MQKLDDQVLNLLAEQVFTASRVTEMLKAIRVAMQEGASKDREQLCQLQANFKDAESALERLHEAVGQGVLPLDDSLTARAQKHRARKEVILIDMSNVRRQQEVPWRKITPKRVDAFTAALRSTLLDQRTAFAKEYLRLLVDEIVVDGKVAEVRGSKASLAEAVLNAGSSRERGTAVTVPTFVPEWRPLGDSNPCYRRERAVS